MDKMQSYLELQKAIALLSHEHGVFKILEHKQAKFQIQVLDVFLNPEAEDGFEILVSSRRIDTQEEKTMPLSTLFRYYS